jgi:hypothetical protein
VTDPPSIAGARLRALGCAPRGAAAIQPPARLRRAQVPTRGIWYRTQQKLAAEFLGTLWLVLGGCGSAVLAAAFREVGIGLHGVSLAFGLTVLTMACAIGHISGCHLNPAGTFGLVAGGRFPASEAVPYIVARDGGGVLRKGAAA